MIKWRETTKGQTELQRFKSTSPPWEKRKGRKRSGKQASELSVAGRQGADCWESLRDAKVERGPGWRWAGEALGHLGLLQEMLVNFGLPLQLM